MRPTEKILDIWHNLDTWMSKEADYVKVLDDMAKRRQGSMFTTIESSEPTADLLYRRIKQLDDLLDELHDMGNATPEWGKALKLVNEAQRLYVEAVDQEFEQFRGSKGDAEKA